MNNHIIKNFTAAFTTIILSTIILTGCGQKEAQNTKGRSDIETESSIETVNAENDADAGNVSELQVRFGDEGTPFMLKLEDNETAKAIARYAGTSDWRLPIYEDDEDADYDVMQYYDLPGTYDIPSNPETITLEKAGEVYYSDPNRIVLFYHDAEITGEYTKVGTFDPTDEFIKAVEENPVLEGWGNKIVHIERKGE